MKRFNQLINNLRYVKVDREAARNHWWTLVEMSQLSPEVYAVNRQMIVENKAVAGILSHKQTRGFILHRLKERGLLRKLERKQQEFNVPVCDNLITWNEYRNQVNG